MEELEFTRNTYTSVFRVFFCLFVFIFFFFIHFYYLYIYIFLFFFIFLYRSPTSPGEAVFRRCPVQSTTFVFPSVSHKLNQFAYLIHTCILSLFNIQLFDRNDALAPIFTQYHCTNLIPTFLYYVIIIVIIIIIITFFFNQCT